MTSSAVTWSITDWSSRPKTTTITGKLLALWSTRHLWSSTSPTFLKWIRKGTSNRWSIMKLSMPTPSIGQLEGNAFNLWNNFLHDFHNSWLLKMWLPSALTRCTWQMWPLKWSTCWTRLSWPVCRQQTFPSRWPVVSIVQLATKILRWQGRTTWTSLIKTAWYTSHQTPEMIWKG